MSGFARYVTGSLCVMLVGSASMAQEPALPAGLAPPAPVSPEPSVPAGLDMPKTTEPALPAGLGVPVAPSEPALPSGLGAPAEEPRLAASRAQRLPEGLSGFWEVRGGARLQDDPYEKAASIGETRLQVQLDRASERAALKVVGDFLYDPVLNQHDIRLEDGDGWLDLRQANLLCVPPHSWTSS